MWRGAGVWRGLFCFCGGVSRALFFPPLRLVLSRGPSHTRPNTSGARKSSASVCVLPPLLLVLCRGAPPSCPLSRGPSHTQPYISGARESSAAHWPRARHRSARLLRYRYLFTPSSSSSLGGGGEGPRARHRSARLLRHRYFFSFVCGGRVCVCVFVCLCVCVCVCVFVHACEHTHILHTPMYTHIFTPESVRLHIERKCAVYDINMQNKKK